MMVIIAVKKVNLALVMGTKTWWKGVCVCVCVLFQINKSGPVLGAEDRK